MFDRFTDRARKVIGLARQAASEMNHQYIGTEHILIGLIDEKTGVACNVLRGLGLDLGAVRDEVLKVVDLGPTITTLGQLPFTPRAKKLLELAGEAATALRHNYVGTEHLLLGVVAEREGVAAQVLMNMGATLKAVHDETLELLGMTINGAPNHDAYECNEATFDDYQDFARTTAVFPGAGEATFGSTAYLALGLTGEAGEVSEKVKKRYRLGGSNAFLPGSVVKYEKTGEEETYEQFRQVLKKELGDVLWYVAGLADLLGFGLSEVADANVEKLSGRKKNGTLKGSGDNR